MINRQLLPSPVVWEGQGINYGVDVVYATSVDYTTVRKELAEIRTCMSRIRFHIPPAHYQPIFVNNCLEVIDIAQEMGFKVVWGSTANGKTLTSTTWQTYHDQTLARAVLAERHNIAEFTIGNEDEYRIDGTTLSIAQFRDNLNQLAAAVKEVYSGVVSYTVSHNHTFGWIARGRGNIDKLALNVYGSHESDHRYFIYILGTFHKAFGDNMYISEYSLTDLWSDVTMTDEQQLRALKARNALIRRLGVKEAYYFTYSHKATDEFAIKKADGTYRAMWWAFTNARKSRFGNDGVANTRRLRNSLV